MVRTAAAGTFWLMVVVDCGGLMRLVKPSCLPLPCYTTEIEVVKRDENQPEQVELFLCWDSFTFAFNQLQQVMRGLARLTSSTL